jgi:UDPglucose 6-dehydrogenase
MLIAIVGTGYVGLVSGTCFAELGHHVICVDKDGSKIAGLSQGKIPIYEPELDRMVLSNVAAGRLAFTTDLAQAIDQAEIVFIAVGTPTQPSNGEADLSYVFEAAKEIAFSAKIGAIVVTKSTVPVGTGDTIERILQKENPEAHLSVVSNPEFLREGSAIVDFMRPDRIIIGTSDVRAQAAMRELYRPLDIYQVPILITGRRTAELIKYTANAFLATKISFINEIADLCEAVGADVREVAIGVGLDSRIGHRFLQPGPGYGGSCFPKDTLALLHTAQDYGVSLRLVEDTVAINDSRKRTMVRKVAEAAGGSVSGMTISVLGLTFKPNTDDMREAPSLALIAGLQHEGAVIRAHDPAGMKHAKLYFDDLELIEDPYECVRGADVIVLMTEWESLCNLDLARVRKLVRQPIFIDLRNVYRAELMAQQGFVFTGVGLGDTKPKDEGSGVINSSSSGSTPGRGMYLEETSVRRAAWAP